MNWVGCIDVYDQGGKQMMAGGAEECGHDSSRVRIGGSEGNFLTILVYQLVLTTFVTTP